MLIVYVHAAKNCTELFFLDEKQKQPRQLTSF